MLVTDLLADHECHPEADATIDADTNYCDFVASIYWEDLKLIPLPPIDLNLNVLQLSSTFISRTEV